MERFNRMLAAAQGMGMGQGSAGGDTNLVDNSETVYISSLALLKMLRHGRAGVPMEVMGLMLGSLWMTSPCAWSMFLLCLSLERPSVSNPSIQSSKPK